MKRPILLCALLALLAFSLIACVNTSYNGTMNIVEANKVLEDVKAGNSVIIDARTAEAYAKGHLTGSLNITPTSLSVMEPVENMLAPKTQVEQVLSANGIKNDAVIYIYDDNAGISAGRVWWTLKMYGHDKVMIVNGGATALAKDATLLTAEPTVPAPSVYVAKEVSAGQIATFEEVKAALGNPGVKLLDVRSQAEYDAGHIPGAILYPHTNNLYKDGTFHSRSDVYLFYKEAGMDKDDDIIVYCRTSYRATQTLALLQEAGFSKVRVYDGAWLEWEKNGGEIERPEGTGASPADGS